MSVARAFILAAGLGTRLKPFSDRLPKPAWPFFDAPIAAHLLRKLHGAGVGEFIVNLHHLPDAMRGSLAPWIPSGAAVRWSVEERILGTGGALVPWIGELSGERFFLANADTHRDFDPSEMADFHLARGADVTLSLTPLPSGTPGPIEIDGEGRIVKFLDASMPGGGRAVRTCGFTGVHLLEPVVLEGVARAAREQEKFCVNQEVHRVLLSRGLRYFGYLPEDSYWSDLGTPESYLATHFHFLERGAPPEGTRGELYLDDSMTPEGGRVVAPTFVGSGARVETGARVGPLAVLCPGAAVAAGGDVRRAVVWAGEAVVGVVENGVVSGWGEILEARMQKGSSK